MTLSELACELRRRGIREDSYCLTGGLPNEAFTIEQAGGKWWVYYSERGCRTSLREFATEAEACAAFLREFAGDVTTRRQSVTQLRADKHRTT
jgi:hypothetical protein